MVIKLETDKGIMERLEGLGQFITTISYTIPITDALGLIAAQTQQNFDNEGSDMQGWADLADYTIKDRVKKGYAEGPILTRSGRLRDSLYMTVEQNYGTYGTDVEYATLMQEGGYNGFANVPARPFLVINERTRNDAKFTIGKHLINEILDYLVG